MQKQRALALGLVSAGVTACGVAMALLVHFMVLTILDQYSGNTSGNDDNAQVMQTVRTNNSLWSIGLVFIVPGACGLIAAFVQNKCMYVTTCVLALISLILMGLVVFFGGYLLIILILGYGNISESCQDTSAGCMCFSHSSRSNSYNSYDSVNSNFKDCDGLSTFASQIIALLSIVIIAWIVLLFECILSCYFACRSGQPTSHGVVVYTPAQEPMVPPPSKPGMSQYPPPGYAGAPQQIMYYEDGRH